MHCHKDMYMYLFLSQWPRLICIALQVDHETEIRKRDDLLFKDKTALSFAVEDNKVEDVISLLQHHAEVNREDSTGK